MTLRITEEWLESNFIDIDAFLAALSAAGYSTEPTGYNGLDPYWDVTGDDIDNNGVPDFLDSLLDHGPSAHNSQGGHGG